MKKLFLTLLLGAAISHAQTPTPQVPLTGTPGSGGSFPFLNSGAFAIPSDADYTPAYPNTSCIVCKITSSVSLTAPRNVIEPTAKMTFNITNATTGGQSIVIKAASGTGVTVANGTSKWVWFDGTNYVEIDPPGSGGSGFPIILGATSIASSSTTTAVTGLTVDGVTPTIFGFLDPTSSVQAQLNAKAPLASPTFTGTPAAPTAAPGTNTTQLATTAFTQAAIAALTFVGSTGSFTVGHCIKVASTGPLVIQDQGAVCGSGGSTSPGGSNTNLQYNNSGAFGGDTNTADDGAGNLSVKTITTTGTSGVAGLVGISGNTTNPAVPANTAGFMGPTSASFTAYSLQLPSTGPTSSLPVLSCGTPTSGVSTCTFVSAGGSSITNTTFAVGTTAIGANACTTSSTVTMTGVATTSVFMISPNVDVSGVTGWGSTGGLVIDAWPTANTLNVKVCNQTSSSITPSASVTFNVGAR